MRSLIWRAECGALATWCAEGAAVCWRRSSPGRWLPAAVLVLLLFPIAGCEQGAAVATPTPVTIRIGGSTAMHPALQELAAAFSREHGNILFDIRGGGSTLGEAQVAGGEIDLAASTLFPPDEDDPRADLLRTPLGVDGVAMVVHISNPVAVLSRDTLRELYSGDLLNWNDVPGLESDRDLGEVLLVSREDGSGARRIFESQVMGEDGVSLTAVVMPSSADVVDYVDTHPQAIGYVSRAFVVDQLAAQLDADGQDDSAAAALRGVRVVAVDGAFPTTENLLDQRYLLARPMYLVSRPDPAEWPRQFVEFALSPAGQAIVGRYHARVR